MGRMHNGPPARLHDAGRARWFKAFKVTCDFCHRPAVERWRKNNVCAKHLNAPYRLVRFDDGTPYVEAVDATTVSYKSCSGAWQES